MKTDLALLNLKKFYENGEVSQEVFEEGRSILKGLLEKGNEVKVLAIVIDPEDSTDYAMMTEETLVPNVNFKKKLGTCSIVIYTNDNYDKTAHPHVHVIPKNGGVHDVCVRLDCALYFKHGKHDGTFNNDQCERFDEIMRTRKKNDNVTIWEDAVGIYNAYRTPTIDRKHQPNYKLLNELKTEEDCEKRDKDSDE